VLIELAKCQLLCVPHHDEKTGRETKRHGVRRYAAGCRCDVCRAAKHQAYLRSAAGRQVVRHQQVGMLSS
jgi:hypothetical protein